MKIIGFNRKRQIFIFPILLSLIVWLRIIDLSDKTEKLFFIIFSILFMLLPPIRNLGLWPKYEAVSEFGFHKVQYWGLKKNTFAWEEVVFKFQNNKLFLFQKNNMNKNIFILDGYYQEKKSSKLFLNLIGVKHPTYEEVLKYSNSLK